MAPVVAHARGRCNGSAHALRSMLPTAPEISAMVAPY
jgi:hypothetical protein